MKKIILTISMLTLLLSLSTSSYAAIDAEIYCPVYGTSHHMENTGYWSEVENNGDYLLEFGSTYQCECGDYFACSGRPHLTGHSIGDYFYDSDLSLNYIISGFANFSTNRTSPRYTSSTTLTGYLFYPWLR